MKSESKWDLAAGAAIAIMLLGAFILPVSSLGLLLIVAAAAAMLLLILNAFRTNS